QESARTAFELLARDLRQAGATGCDNSGRVGSVLGAGPWWRDWGGITGYDADTENPAVSIGTEPGERAAGTDSFQIRSTEGAGFSLQTHDPAAGSMKLNATAPTIQVNDVLLV